MVDENAHRPRVSYQKDEAVMSLPRASRWPEGRGWLSAIGSTGEGISAVDRKPDYRPMTDASSFKNLTETSEEHHFSCGPNTQHSKISRSKVRKLIKSPK